MSDPLRVVLDPRHPRGVAESFRAIDGIDLIEAEDPDGVAAAVRDAAVLVGWKWEDRFLADGLRWIQSISAGVEQFPLDELARRGVALTSARGVHGPQIAEHTFALLLAMTRNVAISTRDATERIWRPRMAEEIAGRTMAIVGLGSIGEEVAGRAVAWDMRVIGIKANPDGYDGVAERVSGPGALLDVCREADVVVSVLPDHPDTRGLFDDEAFAAIGAGWFVNVGRGSAVDEDALVRALDDGELRGAGLDVFEVEPLPDDSPLWSHPRVVVTPHMGGLSPAYGPRLARIFEQNLAAFRGEGAWRNRIV